MTRGELREETGLDAANPSGQPPVPAPRSLVEVPNNGLRAAPAEVHVISTEGGDYYRLDLD